MGEGDFVVRGGYTRSFSRGGLNDFTGVLQRQPRRDHHGHRGTKATTTSARCRCCSAIRRGSDRAAFPTTPTYPMTDVVTQDINGFDPNIQVPYADSWQAGITRSLGKSMALEVRYVGTRGQDGWVTRNYNEQNIVENGFLNEFRLAQANLQANIAAGRGNSFAYAGPNTGTSPLPIFLAHYNAQPAGERRQRRALHRRQLDQRDVPRLPRGAEPESVRVRLDATATQRPGRQPDVPQQLDHRRACR